jgi:hypothetical protein
MANTLAETEQKRDKFSMYCFLPLKKASNGKKSIQVIGKQNLFKMQRITGK